MSRTRPLTPVLPGRRRPRWRALPWLVSAATLLATGAEASFTFSELVIERNTASEGLSSERFADGPDHVDRFNGALGAHLPVGLRYPVGGGTRYGIDLHYTSNLWHLDASTVTTASLGSRFNAGAGWSLSFGELLAPSAAGNSSAQWVYRSPTGKISRFHDTLLDGDPSVAGTHYTRDGSLLRLQVNGINAVVGFASGLEKHFAVRPDGSWRFAEERDVHGNGFVVEELAGSIRITDTTGRVQTLVLQTDPTDPSRSLIDRIELTAFGGATATYELHYGTWTVDLPPQDTDPATPAQTSLAVLTAVEAPDGTQTTFEYVAAGAGSVPASGRLATLGLPTGGFLDYTYRVVELPKVGGALHVADVVGIATRTARAPSQGGKPGSQATWTFTSTLDRDRDTTTNDKPRELTTQVNYPDGHHRLFKASAFAGGNAANDETPPTNFFLRDYGFPFTKSGAVAGDPFYLSEEIYAGSQKLRSRRVRFQWGTCAGCWDQHPRPSGDELRYDDGSGLVETRAELLDDLGRALFRHSFDNAGEVPMRTTTRSYTHGAPSSSGPWVVTGWTSETVHQGGESQVRQRCIDAGTGQVLRERLLAGATPAAHDLVRSHGYQASGERSVTRYYGADVQPLATGDLCTLALPLEEQYAHGWTHQDGVVTSQGWLAADGSLFLETSSTTVDAATGLVASRSGADGFTWTFGYDAQGRPTSTTPPAGHGGATTTTYAAAAGGAGAITTVIVAGSDGSELSKTETELGPFARVADVRITGDGGTRTTSHLYDGMGRRIRTTTPGGEVTRWLGYDAFGRPGTERPPEGSVHDRTYSYQGRSTSETFKIGKTWDEATNSVVEIDRTITLRTDRFSQTLEQHIADADGEFRTTTTTRGLDGGVRTRVVTDGVRTESETLADRTDNRGFTILTPEGDPIVGYDAVGNRTEIDLGEGPVFQIFDRAARLVEQRADSTTGPLWSQNVYATASAGNDYRGGKLVSSLRINRGIPHLSGGEVHVVDAYVYGGDRGGLSERRTTVSAGSQTVFDFVTSQGVDATGETVSLTFPDCDPIANDGFSLCTPRSPRVMETETDHGELVAFRAAVGGVHEPWIDSVVRDGAGRPIQRQLGNGIVEDRDYGIDGRLERLTLTGPGGSFYDSGLAQYDGAGKLVQLGTQRHVAEDAYRLALPVPPTAGNPTSLPSTTVPRDRLGQRTGRDYKVPYRWDPASGVEEQVNEIYVYGPGNRLVWNRRFNDYQATTYRNSEDLWFLTDPSGQQVRQVTALTYYAGTAPQWSNAVVSGVWMHVAGNLTEDAITLGGEGLGSTRDVANSPERLFFHRDFLGRRFAESSPDGTVDVVTAPLF